MKRTLLAAALLILAGCQPNPAPQQSTAHADSARAESALVRPPAPGTWTDSLVNRVWVSTDSSAAPGSLRIFLADGTLLMDSCGEMYRLAAWTAAEDRTLIWHEDTAEIRARVHELSADRLVLAVELVSGPELQSYRGAMVPYVCPEMPR